jgi:hypothetical protein
MRMSVLFFLGGMTILFMILGAIAWAIHSEVTDRDNRISEKDEHKSP